MMEINRLLVLCCVFFSQTIYAAGSPLCASSSYCVTKIEPLLNVLPETSAENSFLRSGTTSHNNTCSEKQIYQSENVSRYLHMLTLNFNPNHTPIYDPYCQQYYTQTSGTVYTQTPITKNDNGFIILHGAITVRAKFNKIIAGIWPAIWMLPINTAFTNLDGGSGNVWPTSGEIDIIELAGYSAFYNPPATYLTTLHFGALPRDETPRGYVTLYKNNGLPEALSDKDHAYTMEWEITLKNTTSSQVTELSSTNVSSILLTMYLDGISYQSDRLIWNSYTPVCNNGLIATGVSNGTTCGVPTFTTPSTYNPISPNDEVPLQAFINGFNSGFRLIINVASGGPVFYADPIGQAGAQEPVSMIVSGIYLETINNFIFLPNIFNGAKLSWLAPTIPGESIDHYQLEISGHHFNVNKHLSVEQTNFTIPSHTLYGNRNYHALVTAVGNLGTSVLVGEVTVHINP